MSEEQKNPNLHEIEELRADEEQENEVNPQDEREPDIVDGIAALIRQNTQKEKLTPKSSFTKEPVNVPEDSLEEVAAELLARESAHVSELKGKKETFYFCNEIMSNNFANMLLLAEEKDIYNTIATLVRFNCKTYPRPTSLQSLTYPPVYLDAERAKNAIAVMKKRGDEYGDIKTVTASNGAPYYYSTQFMSETYAHSLAQYEEVDWKNYP